LGWFDRDFMMTFAGNCRSCCQSHELEVSLSFKKRPRLNSAQTSACQH
jgi:hypothetical protein